MAPKKKVEAPKKILLGRPGNSVSMGIVGMPNVGKSSFFNTLSKLNVPADNFAFCTIDPNVARIPVPDKRFKHLCKSFKPKSEVSAMLAVTDIAGLVKGAASGAGLGNDFLSHIQAVDGIYHMVRAFDDADVSHVEESVDPIRDMEIIHDELRLKDVAQCERFLESNKKVVRSKDKAGIYEYKVIESCLEWLNTGKDIRAKDWGVHEVEVLNKQLFITAKPMVYLVNMSKRNYIAKRSKYLEKIDEYIKGRGANDEMIPFSVVYEQEATDAEMSGGIPEKQKYLKGEGAPSMLPRIIHKGYDCLNLIHYFTAGSDEVRCWTIRKCTLAPQAAGVIHTDFEKGFICADAYTFVDFEEHKTEAAVKAAGKLQQKGRTYEVQDGDILHFKFNN